MTDHVNADNRDQVLLAFHQACEVPTPEDVIAWADKYPQFADDIRSHAAILLDWATQDGLPERMPEEIDLTRARSRALSALHSARTEQAERPQPVASSFDAMIAAKGTNIPALSHQFDIDRTVLSAMVNGRMRPPVGERLMSAWTSFFAVTREAFENALASALASPRLGHANANGPPKIVPQSYEDIVRSSRSMSAERVHYWLCED